MKGLAGGGWRHDRQVRAGRVHGRGFGHSPVVGSLVALALIVAACGSAASPPATQPGGGAGGGSGYGGGSTTAPSRGAATPGSAGGGGSASAVDTCALLSPDEIHQALGVDVKPGVKQTTDTSSTCEWDSQDGTSGVSVQVAQYDDAVWQAMAGSKLAVAVSGLGEAAYKGYPHAGDLAIKRAAYEIDLGIVDFQATSQALDAADLALAKLVLSRL